ncbi:hypothetical protein ACQPXS_00715 [Streptomyces sp. CA-142005]|uniref:hypothetical protein n=1 Tax=Streptomyces sp. CA-142005 TaxID=3240052 RepID=UPI003D8D7374
MHLAPTPRKVPTLRGHGQVLRALAAFGAAQHLPDDFGLWAAEDFHRYLAVRLRDTDATAMRPHIAVIKLLHRLAPILSMRLPADPWHGQSAGRVLGLSRDDELRTPVVEPATWFPLIHAAWSYIDVFGPDILRARSLWRSLQAGRQRLPADQQRHRQPR